MTRADLVWAAGVWEQHAEESGFVAWSRHATEPAAIRAARRYAREQLQATGGALSWCGGVCDPSGAVRWYHADGSRPAPCKACEARRIAGFDGQCPACAYERARSR